MMTALHIACAVGDSALVKLLIEEARCEVLCSSPPSPCSTQGSQPLAHILLLREGPECFMWQILPRDDSDRTPLHIAVGEGHLDTALQLVDSSSNRGEDFQAVPPLLITCLIH